MHAALVGQPSVFSDMHPLHLSLPCRVEVAPAAPEEPAQPETAGVPPVVSVPPGGE